MHKSGAFIASAKGQIGPVCDQSALWDIFAQSDTQDAAYEALHRFMKI